MFLLYLGPACIQIHQTISNYIVSTEYTFHPSALKASPSNKGQPGKLQKITRGEIWNIFLWLVGRWGIFLCFAGRQGNGRTIFDGECTPFVYLVVWNLSETQLSNNLSLRSSLFYKSLKPPFRRHCLSLHYTATQTKKFPLKYFKLPPFLGKSLELYPLFSEIRDVHPLPLES